MLYANDLSLIIEALKQYSNVYFKVIGASITLDDPYSHNDKLDKFIHLYNRLANAAQPF